MKNNLVIIKLGGSVITFKEKSLSANIKAIEDISKILKRIENPMILIHGGGSFGHYWSVKFDMHTKPAKYDPHGISKVHTSMLTLNKIILDILEDDGLNLYGISPSSFLKNGKLDTFKVKELKKMTEHNIIPITYGDIVHIFNNKYFILSGDVLMTTLSKILKPSKIIFTLNVDGLYNNTIDKKIIKEVNFGSKVKLQKQTNFQNDINIADVTGGIKRKVEEAKKISREGLDVIFLNGLNPIQIENAVTDKEFRGTIFKGKI
ncbi:MAG TPA: isopentenyl phosphate kinase [Nitrososphaeraceae archaeon]|nr:isopentenyl phosphate kinase [Nitrososphaeraceae archaeon]